MIDYRKISQRMGVCISHMQPGRVYDVAWIGADGHRYRSSYDHKIVNIWINSANARAGADWVAIMKICNAIWAQVKS